MTAPTTAGMDDDALDRVLWPLLRAHCPLSPTALCPSLSAFQAIDELPLWQALERALGRQVEAPFFAVAWPGAQALAREILDGSWPVRGLRVVDLGCGSGLAAVAAATCGARQVTAADVDELALSACRALAHAHAVKISTARCGLPLLGSPAEADTFLRATEFLATADMLLVGDLVYSRPLGHALQRLLLAVPSALPNLRVLIADSGRPYFAETVGANATLTPLRKYTVPVPPAVEGRSQRTVTLYSGGGPAV